MKSIYFLTALFCSLFPLTIQAQAWQFAKRYSAPISSSFSNNAIANAPDGSTYIVGRISGNVMLDSVTVSGPSNVNRGYLFKLNAAGQAVWVKLFDEKPYHVTCDAQGNVFLGGSILTIPGQADSLAIVHKFSAAGQLLATYKAGGTARSWVKVLKNDAAGNCYVTGWKSGEANFGGYLLPNSNSRDNFLIKLSPDLSQVSWAVQTGSSGNLDEVNGLDLDATGGVYTSGNYSQTYNFFGASYSGSFFTEKRSAATGGLLWQKIFSSGSGTSTKQFVTLSGDGESLYATASFKKTVQIAPGISLTAQSGTDDYHLFVANLNAATGNVNWAKKITLTGDSYHFGTVWTEDQLHLHGYFQSTTLVGNILLEPLGNNDAYYVKLEPTAGSVVHAEKFSGTKVDQGLGIAADYGSLSLGGRTTSSPLNIGTLSLSGTSNSIYVTKRIIDLPLKINLAEVGNPSCPGAADGSATVNVLGGKAPYTFLWSNGQTDSIAVSLLAGTYTVTVMDNAGMQASTSVTISGPPALTVGFSFVTNNLDASFSNNSTNAASYFWTFGDGQNSTAANPTHSYSNNGTYTVTLIAQNQCGTDTISKSVSAGVAPNADFVADKVEICLGDTVQFNNLSTGAQSYTWEFPGANPSISMANNPMVVYTAAGVYPVTLTASNAFGTDIQTKAALITVIGFPTADFTIDSMGLSITLTNNSQNANSFMWNFGDGNTSLLTAPTHTYSMPGHYVIQLTAQNQCGASILEHSVSVGTSATNNPNWLTDLRLFPNPNKGAFTLEMTGTTSDKVQLSLLGPDGRVISSETVAFSGGRLIKAFEYETLPSGMYLLQIMAEGSTKFVKVLVQR